MSEIVSSFEALFEQFWQALQTDLQALYSALVRPDPPPRETGLLVEAVEAEERRENNKPADPLTPKPDERTPEEKAVHKEKAEELKQHQKETGSDEAKAEYEAKKEEIQVEQGTHDKHNSAIKDPIYRK